MSSHSNNPLKEQDNPLNTSGSHSDIDEAEENMEQLKIEERQSKEAAKKVSPEPEGSSQKGPSTSDDERIAGPSGLQKTHLENPDGIAVPETENIRFIANVQKKDIERLKRIEQQPPRTASVTPTYLRKYLKEMSDTDSANTSSDVSEIRSEIAANSDAQEHLPKEQSPSIKTALERTFSEASEANISEIDEDPSIIPSLSGSTPTSSSNSYEVERKECRISEQEEAEFKKSLLHRVQKTTRPVIGLIKQSELSPEQALREEDKDRVSILPEQRSEEETQDSTSEKMQTTPEKGCGAAEEISGPSASKQTIDKKPCGTKAIRARGEDIEASGFERRVRKPKRGSQLGNSPPSDENLDSSPQKASATCRPNKKSRCDEVLLPTGRTGHDDGDSIEKHSYGNPQHDQSKSSSDSNDCRDSDKETAL